MKKNKLALVTGGSRGLGKEMALRLAEHGHDVILTYHTQKDAGDEVVKHIESLGQKAAALSLDTSNVSSLTEFVQQVQ
ncbi:MAG: SDR family NAD(P)-dependent oxidoreductase, partial [Ginsengibacter sp.]